MKIRPSLPNRPAFRNLLLAAAALLLAGAGAARATDYTWTGATSTPWDTATNWSPNGTPGSGDNFVGDSTGAVSITLAIHDYTIQNYSSTGNVTLNYTQGTAINFQLTGSITEAATSVLAFRGAAMTVQAANVVINPGGQIYFGATGNQYTPIGGLTVTNGISFSGGSGNSTGFLQFNVASDYTAGLITFGGANANTVILDANNANGVGNSNSRTANVSGLSSAAGTGTQTIFGSQGGFTGTTNLSGTHNVTLAINNTTDYTTKALLVDYQTNTSGFAVGTLTLTKAGTGTQTLTGASTYTGGTTVNAGTLLGDNISGSAFGTGAVQVNNGARLGGSGLIGLTSGNAVTVASGGVLLAGDGAAAIGSLTFTNTALTMQSGSLLEFYVDVSNAHSTLARSSGSTAVWTFASAQSVEFLDAKAGTYSGLITGLGSDPGNVNLWQLASTPGFNAIFSYDAALGGSIDVTLTAAPEPGTNLLCLLALALCAGHFFLARRAAPAPSRAA